MLKLKYTNYHYYVRNFLKMIWNVLLVPVLFCNWHLLSHDGDVSMSIFHSLWTRKRTNQKTNEQRTTTNRNKTCSLHYNIINYFLVIGTSDNHLDNEIIWRVWYMDETDLTVWLWSLMTKLINKWNRLVRK